ncbi:MAG: TonB-dependent receptor [Rhodopila sp.]|jgi:iron complex outermembrane receptor protein
MLRAALAGLGRGNAISCANLGRFLLAMGLAWIVFTSPARAQSVDYSGFEQLFGEPVTTSATGKPQRISEVPANMEIITADDIRRSGADNIPDILQFVAGISVRRYGFAAVDVGIRGYNETSNPRLLVLLNGQQVYLDDLGRTQWYTLPVTLEEIRQIEIVKGPNTALFGFNAVSGVINIITYDPSQESINTATLRGGTQDYMALSAVGTGRIADVGGIRLSADGFRADEFKGNDVAPGDLPYRSSPERSAVSLDARVQAASNVQLTLSGAAVDTRIWEATSSPYYGTDFERTNWARAGLAADTDFGLINLSAYRNELLYVYNGASEWENINDTVVVVQASDLLKLNADHTIRIGLDFRDNSATSDAVLAGRVGYDVYSTSTMWDWQITPSVSLTNAVRYDHFVLNQQGYLVPQVGYPASDYNGRTINKPSFNSGLVWKATDQDTFRLLGARGLQLPSIYDLGLQDREPPGPDGQGYLFLGNPGVNAASINNIELDWDRALPALNATLRTAVFAQRTDNILINPYETTASGDGILLNGVEEQRALAQNVGSSSAIGTEIGLRGHTSSGFRWNASYSFISITDRLSINQNGIYSPQNFAQGTPTHVLVAGGGYTYGRWEFDAQSKWQSWFLDYRANPEDVTLQPIKVGNYFLADARVGYRVTDNITLALSAQQFNMSQLLVSAGPPIQRRIFLSLTIHL